MRQVVCLIAWAAFVLALLAVPARGADPPKRTAPVAATKSDNAPKLVVDPRIDTSALPTATITPKPPCGTQKVKEVRATATKTRSEVDINCSLTLAASHVISKRLVFDGPAATGVTVECNGARINGFGTPNHKPGVNWAMVEIRSSAAGRAQNITLRNCKIDGSVSIHLGDFFDYAESMRRSGHTERVRNLAPRGILFDNVTITGKGYIPLYLFPGVSEFQLLNSEIKGTTNAVNIYLDAESFRNTFRNNSIHATLTGNSREVMAIDGSSDNVIVNNHFSSLHRGGIYLYRNCGESGTIRHSTPSNNIIVNNVFNYDKYRGSCPAVYVGSRSNGIGLEPGEKTDDCQKVKDYCGKDKGFPFGSSASDLDHAQFNVVMQNQIVKRSVRDMIRAGRPDPNSPNYVQHNQTVTKAIERKAGCFVKDGFEKDFILHGQFINRFNLDGEPVCTGYRYTCNDGALTKSRDLTCAAKKIGDVLKLETR